MRRISRKRSIDAMQFVHLDSGELLHDVAGGDVLSVNVRTEMVFIESNDFVTVDTQAVMYLRTVFSSAEMGRINDMCHMIKKSDDYNVLRSLKTGKVHTKETLMKELDVHRNTFDPFLKKLIDNSVVYLLTGMRSRRKVVYYVLNPTLARRRKTFPRSCVQYFEDFRRMNLVSIKEQIQNFEEKQKQNETGG
jgi:hypothetical protein